MGASPSLRAAAAAEETWAGAEQEEATGAGFVHHLIVAGAAFGLLFSVMGTSPAQAYITGIEPTDNKPTEKQDLVAKVDSFKTDYKEKVNVQPYQPQKQVVYREIQDGGNGNAKVSNTGMPMYDPLDRR